MGRIRKGVDIRELGDGNAGAANTFREIGPWQGITVGLLDAGKGAGAVLVTKALASPDFLVLLVGLAAVVGHNWPILLHFKGGRGESTTIGVLLMTIPNATSIGLGIAALPLLRTGSVILASAFLFVPLPLIAWRLGASGMLILYSILLPCLVGFTHFLTTRKKQPLAMEKK